MSLTYNETVYLFNRSLDWKYLSDEERSERIKGEKLKIDWELVPDEIGWIIYEKYYKEER